MPDRWRVLPEPHQANVAFPDWDDAENVAAARIAPRLDTDGLLSAWWFIRKHPCWRIRYMPANPETAADVERHLDELAAAEHITGWTRVVYEREANVFGGAEAMITAHRLFHADSRALLAYLRDQSGGRHCREILLMLCSVMMRAARQDWFEQGDVRAHVAACRKPVPGTPPAGPGLHAAIRQFLTADAESQMRVGALLGHYARWADSWAGAGRELAALAASGHLHRAPRDVMAHQVIFAWNRLGLPCEAQSALAGTAKTVVFGPDPAMAATG